MEETTRLVVEFEKKRHVEHDLLVLQAFPIVEEERRRRHTHAASSRTPVTTRGGGRGADRCDRQLEFIGLTNYPTGYALLRMIVIDLETRAGTGWLGRRIRDEDGRRGTDHK